MKRHLCLLFAALLAGTAARGSSNSPAAYIGLHTEGEAHDGAKMVRPDIVNGEKRYFRISPDVVTRHFEAFRAFVSEDGTGYGVALRMNDEGRRAMAVMVSTNQGRLARTIVNGKKLDLFRVDTAGEDGYFIVWGGLDAADLKLLAKKLKRLDAGGLPGENVKPPKKGKEKKNAR